MAHHTPVITISLSMYHHSLITRIVSLDVRSKALAYAVLDGPLQLLDFGVSGSTHRGFPTDRVEKIVRKFQPQVIVLRKVPAGSKRDNPAVQASIKSIRSKARHLSIPVVSIEKRLIDQTFRRHCKPTKYQIALLLSACFSALRWYVPQKRKIWMPEDRRMQYFDAAALGLTYFATQQDAETVQQFLSEAVSRSPLLMSGA
ncbi:MAG: hypothetical protein WCE63_04120 [Acidobacteriaceae bacterium]